LRGEAYPEADRRRGRSAAAAAGLVAPDVASGRVEVRRLTENRLTESVGVRGPSAGDSPCVPGVAARVVEKETLQKK